MGEESFLMNLCYPSFALEDVIARLSVQYFSRVQSEKDKQRIRQIMGNQLKKTSMDVRIILGTSKITVRDLLSMEKGDVLVLDSSIDSTLPVIVKDQVKFRGRPGMRDGNMAVRITDIVKE